MASTCAFINDATHTCTCSSIRLCHTCTRALTNGRQQRRLIHDCRHTIHASTHIVLRHITIFDASVELSVAGHHRHGFEEHETAEGGEESDADDGGDHREPAGFLEQTCMRVQTTCHIVSHIQASVVHQYIHTYIHTYIRIHHATIHSIRMCIT